MSDVFETPLFTTYSRRAHTVDGEGPVEFAVFFGCGIRLDNERATVGREVVNDEKQQDGSTAEPVAIPE